MEGLIGIYSPRDLEILIDKNYGDKVSFDGKTKTLIKFGRNDDVGTSFETVWVQGGTETYATDNDIDTVSSSNSGDDQDIIIEGHTVDSNGDLTFLVQTVTLDGQNKALLGTPLYRATRMYNNDSTSFVGDVYVYEDDTLSSGVPTTTANIHLKALSTDNQSLKCATSVSKDDYWVITSASVGVDRQQTRSVDFRLQVRESGKVFRTIYPISGNSNNGTTELNFEEPLIVKPNSDVRIIAASSGTGTGVTAAIHGILAIKESTLG